MASDMKNKMPLTRGVDKTDSADIRDGVMKPNFTTLNQIFDTIKNAAVALVGLFALLLVSVVLIRSFNTSDITFDSVKVPESFTEVGYTSEITTTQILDEVAKIHAQSSTSIGNNKKKYRWLSVGRQLDQIGVFARCWGDRLQDDTNPDSGNFRYQNRKNIR